MQTIIDCVDIVQSPVALVEYFFFNWEHNNADEIQSGGQQKLPSHAGFMFVLHSKGYTLDIYEMSRRSPTRSKGYTAVICLNSRWIYVEYMVPEFGDWINTRIYEQYLPLVIWYLFLIDQTVIP